MTRKEPGHWLPKRQLALALLCYLAIPVVLVGGAGLSHLINPELARGSADYSRNFQLLALAGTGVLLAAGGIAGLLWLLTCYFFLQSRERSLAWMLLAFAGPPGFCVMAMLRDRAPLPGDLYQRFIGALKAHWRVVFEAAVFVSVWSLTYAVVVVQRELMVFAASLLSGTPVAVIVNRQNASSGMWAAGEAMEMAGLAVLAYLLWPVLFNLIGRIASRVRA